MVVSDAGISSSKPEWWNASPSGCLLISLQPRGGWQILQRAVQWGDDWCARVFGVTCKGPDLYNYFSCSIRNRLELWNSQHFESPTQGETEGKWHCTPKSSVTRPTKLLEGGGGGQAFICDLLRPVDMTDYSIDIQAHMQFLSILMVAAGLMADNVQLQNSDKSKVRFIDVLSRDFALDDGLSIVFRPIAYTLFIAVAAVFALAMTVFYSFWVENLYGQGIPYVSQIASISIWVIGALGLLMLGGNPRVKLGSQPIKS